MVSHFVRDDVGARKVARARRIRGELPVKRQIDVDLLIARAVERSGGGAGETAGGAHLSAEQHQLGRNIGLAHVLEIGAPDILGLAENGADEIDLGSLAAAVVGSAGPAP